MADVEFRSDVTVELVRAAAQDADVLFAARVSTKGEHSLEDVGGDAERSQGLINYLMRDRHGSPFVIRGRSRLCGGNLQTSCN